MTSVALDPNVVRQLIEQAVQDQITSAVENLGQDSEWLARIEHMINQAVVQRTVSSLYSTNVDEVIKSQVDKNMEKIGQQFLTSFSSTGIEDRATSCQFTIMDDTSVFENLVTAKDLEVLGNTVVNDLTIKGSINTDNRSWDTLVEHVSKKTLNNLTDTWTNKLIAQVRESIKSQGIDLTDIKVNGNFLIQGNKLANTVTESNLQTLGTLKELKVNGEAQINNTVSVVNRRLGINTQAPEMALSVWDEEISVVIGKNKAKQAYIGTNRDNSLVIGVNRTPQIEIDVDGLTTVKKLRVGVHRISHDTQVPGWSGTKGDLVFNANPGPDRVFAWVCLGAYKWQSLKSSE